MSAVYKPSSVADDHLSRPAVASGLQRLPGSVTGRHIMLPYQSCTRWGLQSGQVAMPLVSSYLAFPPLPSTHRATIGCPAFRTPGAQRPPNPLRPRYARPRPQNGGISLLHFPWSRLHRPLTGTLPYGARTFLTRIKRLRPSNNLTKSQENYSCTYRMRPQLSHSTIFSPACSSRSVAEGSDM